MGKHTYQAMFVIGARLAGSFSRAMGLAQGRLRALRRTAAMIGTALKGLAFGIVGLLGVGGFGAAKIFRSLFEGAVEQAIEARHRVHELTASFMRLDSIRKKGGEPLAKQQVQLMMKQTAELGKQGVLHKDIFQSLAVGVARYRVPPQQALEASKKLGDVLVVQKGVNASIEDGVEMGRKFGMAVSSGMPRMVKQLGVLNKEEAKRFGKLTSSAERYKFLMEALKKFGAENIKQSRTEEGRIVMMRNAIRTTRGLIGEQLLPIYAEMADKWAEALPQITPAILDSIRVGGKLLKGLGEWMQSTGTPAVKEFAEWMKGIGVQPQWLGKDFTASWNTAFLQWKEFRIDFAAGIHIIAEGLRKIGTDIIEFVNNPIQAIINRWNEFRALIGMPVKMGNLMPGLAAQERANILSGGRAPGSLPNPAPAQSTAPALPTTPVPQFQLGGLVRSMTLAKIGERGPEMVIPLNNSRRSQGLLDYAAQRMGMPSRGVTTLTFSPVITINGNATETEQRAMDSRLRDLARDFIHQFSAAQYQERRLSYQGGYG